MKNQSSKGTRSVFLLLSCLLVSSATADQPVREVAVAGSWYPDDAGELTTLLDGLLDAAADTKLRISEPLRALILPHAGYSYSGATAAKGLVLLRGRDYHRVVVIGPSHHAGYHGISIAAVDAYQTPLGRIPLDRKAIAQLRDRLPAGLGQSHPNAHRHEHSIEMELPLLQRTLKPGWQLLPILVGDLRDEDYPRLATALRPLLDDHTLLVVSSDFTHYGARFRYQPFPEDAKVAARLRELDHGALDQIIAKDRQGFLAYQRRTGITICGLRPIALLLELLPKDAQVEAIAYTTSGALTGDYGNSVSYYAIAIGADQSLAAASAGAQRQESSPAVEKNPEPTSSATPLRQDELQLLHQQALDGIDAAVFGTDAKRRITIAKDQWPPGLRNPAGAFVTLKRNGRLRGCIGYIEPIKPMNEAVLANGYNAARNDHRFSPLQARELQDLDVEVSILTPPRAIASYTDFTPGEQGIILEKDGRSAVFLPEVATEQGWNREQTLIHLARKAGLPGDAWKQGAIFKVFESQTYTAPYSKTQ